MPVVSLVFPQVYGIKQGTGGGSSISDNNQLHQLPAWPTGRVCGLRENAVAPDLPAPRCCSHGSPTRSTGLLGVSEPSRVLAAWGGIVSVHGVTSVAPWWQ